MAIPMINDIRRQKMSVLRTTDVADGVKEIVLQPSRPAPLLPGQFAGIGIDDGNGPKGYRAYSVLTEADGKYTLCIKKVEGGRGSTFLHSLPQGSTVEVLHPLGYFGFPQKLANDLLFIATGTGIVPILSLLENLPKNFTGSARLIFGVRSEKDLFYEDRIRQVTHSNPSVTATITLSQPAAEWTGAVGRVTAVLEHEPVKAGTQCFICGNGSMIASARAILRKKGVKARNIFYEDFNE
jgi:CDP-4-dehydro-6-deoxyglucose reductase